MNEVIPFRLDDVLHRTAKGLSPGNRNMELAEAFVRDGTYDYKWTNWKVPSEVRQTPIHLGLTSSQIIRDVTGSNITISESSSQSNAKPVSTSGSGGVSEKKQSLRHSSIHVKRSYSEDSPQGNHGVNYNNPDVSEKRTRTSVTNTNSKQVVHQQPIEKLQSKSPTLVTKTTSYNQTPLDITDLQIRMTQLEQSHALQTLQLQTSLKKHELSTSTASLEIERRSIEFEKLISEKSKLFSQLIGMDIPIDRCLDIIEKLFGPSPKTEQPSGSFSRTYRYCCCNEFCTKQPSSENNRDTGSRNMVAMDINTAMNSASAYGTKNLSAVGLSNVDVYAGGSS